MSRGVAEVIAELAPINVLLGLLEDSAIEVVLGVSLQQTRQALDLNIELGAPIDNKSPASFVIKSGPGGRNRCLEAAEPSTNRLLRRAHPGRGPAICGRSLTTVNEELAKRRNGSVDPGFSHVRDRNGLSVEYAGWVRIVGT
jgi:hypothetical protein